MIENRSHVVYRGPNIWTRMPAIRLVTDIGELEDRPTNKIPGFYERLTELIPSLYDHYCSVGKPGGFLTRMREGTWMGHVLEHVALEIQNLAGAEVGRGKTRSTGERGVYNVVYEYEQEDVALAAADLATRTLNHLIYDTEPGFDFQHELEEKVIRSGRTIGIRSINWRDRFGSDPASDPCDSPRPSPITRSARAWMLSATDLGNGNLRNGKHRG